MPSKGVGKMTEFFKCEKCGKKAKTKQALERHAAYHEDDRPFSCEICLQRFKNSDDRGKHYRRLRRDGKFLFACQVCHKHFKSDLLLSKHQAMLGCKNLSSETSGQPENSTLKNGLTVTVEDDVLQPASESSCEPAKPKPEGQLKCLCKTCEMSFESADALKIHYVHVHNDYKKQVCRQCGVSLSSKDSLARHYSIFHQDDFPYQCELCGQKFKIKESLCRHLKFVHKDGGYPCNVCHRTFSQLANLKKHLTLHERNKDSMCSYCGRQFTWKQAFKKHLMWHEKMSEDCDDVNILADGSKLSDTARDKTNDGDETKGDTKEGEVANVVEVDKQAEILDEANSDDKKQKGGTVEDGNKANCFQKQSICDDILDVEEYDAETDVEGDDTADEITAHTRNTTAEDLTEAGSDTDDCKQPSGVDDHMPSYSVESTDNVHKTSCDHMGQDTSAANNKMNVSSEIITGDQTDKGMRGRNDIFYERCIEKSPYEIKDAGSVPVVSDERFIKKSRPERKNTDSVIVGDERFIKKSRSERKNTDSVIVGDDERFNKKSRSKRNDVGSVPNVDTVRVNKTSRCKRKDSDSVIVGDDERFIKKSRSKRKDTDSATFGDDVRFNKKSRCKRKDAGTELGVATFEGYIDSSNISNANRTGDTIDDEINGAVDIDNCCGEVKSKRHAASPEENVFHEDRVVAKRRRISLAEDASGVTKISTLLDDSSASTETLTHSSVMEVEVKNSSSSQEAKPGNAGNLGNFVDDEIDKTDTISVLNQINVLHSQADIDKTNTISHHVKSASTRSTDNHVMNKSTATMATTTSAASRDGTFTSMPGFNAAKIHTFRPSCIIHMLKIEDTTDDISRPSSENRNARPPLDQCLSDDEKRTNVISPPESLSYTPSPKTPHSISSSPSPGQLGVSCDSPGEAPDSLLKNSLATDTWPDLRSCSAVSVPDVTRDVTTPRLGEGKFSLVKQMLTLQDDNMFDMRLFDNPLYSKPVQSCHIKNFAAMHRISDSGPGSYKPEYDLSMKQSIPFHWLGLSVNKGFNMKQLLEQKQTCAKKKTEILDLSQKTSTDIFWEKVSSASTERAVKGIKGTEDPKVILGTLSKCKSNVSLVSNKQTDDYHLQTAREGVTRKGNRGLIKEFRQDKVTLGSREMTLPGEDVVRHLGKLPLLEACDLGSNLNPLLNVGFETIRPCVETSGSAGQHVLLDGETDENQESTISDLAVSSRRRNLNMTNVADWMPLSQQPFSENLTSRMLLGNNSQTVKFSGHISESPSVGSASHLPLRSSPTTGNGRIIPDNISQVWRTPVHPQETYTGLSQQNHSQVPYDSWTRAQVRECLKTDPSCIRDPVHQVISDCSSGFHGSSRLFAEKVPAVQNTSLYDNYVQTTSRPQHIKAMVPARTPFNAAYRK